MVNRNALVVSDRFTFGHQAKIVESRHFVYYTCLSTLPFHLETNKNEPLVSKRFSSAHSLKCRPSILLKPLTKLHHVHYRHQTEHQTAFRNHEILPQPKEQVQLQASRQQDEDWRSESLTPATQPPAEHQGAHLYARYGAEEPLRSLHSREWYPSRSAPRQEAPRSHARFFVPRTAPFQDRTSLV